MVFSLETVWPLKSLMGPVLANPELPQGDLTLYSCANEEQFTPFPDASFFSW